MKSTPTSTIKNIESVWDYPRPPAVEAVKQVIKVIFNGEIIAESRNTKRVLETSHPPVYYIPLEDVKLGVLRLTVGKSWCEWKGQAFYYDVTVNDQTAKKAAWFYPNPVNQYIMIKDHVAFYPSKMEACFVGDEQVTAQEGDFYGGWITSNIVGPFKGGPGTAGW